MIISICARAEPNLSAGIHNLNSGYASLFNRRLTDEQVTTLAKQFGGVSAAATSKLLSRAELRRWEDPHW